MVAKTISDLFAERPITELTGSEIVELVQDDQSGGMLLSTLLTRMVGKGGDTMTGALGLPSADPTHPDHAARKAYVDAMTAKPPVWNDYPSSPSLSLPNYMRRRYLDVGGYCSQTDTVSEHAAIQAAFNDGYGREIVFTNPVGGARYYRCRNRADGRLYLPTKCRVSFSDGAMLDFSDYGRSGTNTFYLHASGVYTAAIALAADGLAGDTTITLAAGGGAQAVRGMWAYVISNALFTQQDLTIGTKGEWLSIEAVAGDELTFGGRLRDSYLTADSARVHLITDPAQVIIDNPQIIGAGRFASDVLGDAGIWIQHGVGCEVNGGFVKYADRIGVGMKTVLNGKVDGVLVEMEAKGSNGQNQYAVAIADGCEAVDVVNCDALNGKEGYTLTVSGPIQGVSRDVTFRANRARNMWRSGICSHDNHVNWLCQGNILENCEQGIDSRIIDATFKNNIIKRTGKFTGSLDCGVQLGSGAGKVRFEGNTYEDVLRGIWMGGSIVHEVAPGDITITGEVMRGVRSRGVHLDYRLNPTGGGSNPDVALGTVTIIGCDIEGVTSGPVNPCGIELHGKFTAPVVALNVIRGGTGLGTRCITLNAANNGAGTNGAINPVVAYNMWSSGYIEPGIASATGIIKNIGNIGIGHWTLGESLRGSKNHNFGEIAGGAFESTTVSVPGVAIGDMATAWMDNYSAPGIWFLARVSAPDTVAVWALNFTGGPLNISSGTLYVQAIKA